MLKWMLKWMPKKWIYTEVLLIKTEKPTLYFYLRKKTANFLLLFHILRFNNGYITRDHIRFCKLFRRFWTLRPWTTNTPSHVIPWYAFDSSTGRQWQHCLSSTSWFRPRPPNLWNCTSANLCSIQLLRDGNIFDVAFCIFIPPMEWRSRHRSKILLLVQQIYSATK